MTIPMDYSNDSVEKCVDFIVRTDLDLSIDKARSLHTEQTDIEHNIHLRNPENDENVWSLPFVARCSQWNGKH